jgi:phospholipid/cholesterol/gamma-HCH transport system permease protein
MRTEGSSIIFEGALTKETVPEIERSVRRNFSSEITHIDLSGVDRIDSAGAALVHQLTSAGKRPIETVGASERVQSTIELFAPSRKSRQEERGPGWLERLGGRIENTASAVKRYLVLASEITFWTLAAPFDRSSRRKGSVADQCERIGLSAVPIVGFLSLILGVIVVLQSAAQLRRFGAALFVSDLLGVSVSRETGPLFTAIIVAGRSGSAITAQLSTMKVTQEIDALRVMALDPVRYVVVPMMLGMLLSIPVLTAFSILVGIGGGLGIASLSLDLTAAALFSRLVEIVGWLDLFVGVVKSFFFGAAIVFTATYFGFSARGGSVGVGAATTRSVVVSIFLVILLNALFSILYLL